ncbi:MAG: preprotein translocase subunit YajC [Desulfobulbaceae bacterium]|nr:preprotein translocase subunit YajC [Desulfobulbaceae bacterium]
MIDVAYAAAGAASPQQGGLLSMLPLVLIFVVFYFLLIRPQQKKAKEQQEFLSALEKGQVVVTSGGIQGKVTGLTDKVVTLEVADNVRIKVSRPYIMGLTVTADGAAGAACSIGGG